MDKAQIERLEAEGYEDTAGEPCDACGGDGEAWEANPGTYTRVAKDCAECDGSGELAA